MGRIKSTMIKKAAKQLMESDISFTTEFNKNKKTLGNTMPSKSTRNKIAGYISHLVKMKQQPPKPVKKAVPAENAF